MLSPDWVFRLTSPLPVPREVVIRGIESNNMTAFVPARIVNDCMPGIANLGGKRPQTGGLCPPFAPACCAVISTKGSRRQLALAKLRSFALPTGTPFSECLQELRVIYRRNTGGSTGSHEGGQVVRCPTLYGGVRPCSAPVVDGWRMHVAAFSCFHSKLWRPLFRITLGVSRDMTSTITGNWRVLAS